MLELLQPQTEDEKTEDHPLETIQGLLEQIVQLQTATLDEVRRNREDIEAFKAIFAQLEDA
ncbi:hypothetical protein [Roseivivax sp. CAU 1761]